MKAVERRITVTDAELIREDVPLMTVTVKTYASPEEMVSSKVPEQVK